MEDMKTQCLMYAALLAHCGLGVTEARIIDILTGAGYVYEINDIRKLVVALETLDIEQIRKMSTTLAQVPVVVVPEPEPEIEIEEEEDDDYGLAKLFG